MSKNLENILLQWNNSLRRWNSPSLNEPEIVEELDGKAAFDFKYGKVILGEKTIEDLQKYGLSEEEIVNGAFDHEIGHYMVYPYNLSKMIEMAFIAEEYFDDKGEAIFQYHADMVVDTYNVLRDATRDNVLKLRSSDSELVQEEGMKIIRRINHEYLCKQGDVDCEIKFGSELESMLKINFGRDADHIIGLFFYGNLIKDHLDNESGQGMSSVSGKSPKKIIKESSEEDIKNALKDLIQGISKQKYEKIKNWIDEIRDEEKPSRIGISSNELRTDERTAEYYMQIANTYPLLITKIPHMSDEEKEKFQGTEKIKIGGDSTLMLPETSGGKILPNLTRKIKKVKSRRRTIDYKEPHLLVVIDSSGSMPDPSSYKSPAALGASVVARSYHARGRFIGGINFDSEASVLEYTRDYRKAIRFITSYKGGGTEIDIEKLRKMLEQPEKNIENNLEELLIKIPMSESEKYTKKRVDFDINSVEMFRERKIDLYMFTDGDIMNQDDLLRYLSNLDNLNRAAVILTSGDRDNIKNYSSKIKVMTLRNDEDIPNIAIKHASDSFYSDDTNN